MNVEEVTERISVSLNTEFSGLASHPLVVEELLRREAHGSGKMLGERAKGFIPFVGEKYGVNLILSSECRLNDKRETRIALELPLVTFAGKFAKLSTGEALLSICRIGSVIEYSVPFTILAKEVSPGFLKLRRGFVPLINPEEFDSDKLFKKKIGWNSLLENLNQDKELETLLGNIPRKTNPVAGLKSEFKDDDSFSPNKCLGQLIPYGTRTFVAFQFAPELWTNWDRLEHVCFPCVKDLVKIIQRVAGYIKDFSYQEETEGFVAASWPVFGILREWCKE